MTDEARIRRNMIILGALTFLVLVIMILGYSLKPYKELQKNITTATATYDTTLTTAKGLGASQLDVVKAQQEQYALNAQLAFFRGRYRSLAIDIGEQLTLDKFGNKLELLKAAQNARLYGTLQRWLREYTRGYGLALERELDAAVAASGVSYATASTTTGATTSTSSSSSSSSGRGSGSSGNDTVGTAVRPSITIDRSLAPANPEQIKALIPANGFLTPVPPIPMAVKGDLGSILRFFDLVTSDQSDILKTIGTIKLDGNSPNITASFVLTPYLVASGPSVVLAATGGGAASSAATGTTAASSSSPASSSSASSPPSSGASSPR